MNYIFFVYVHVWFSFYKGISGENLEQDKDSQIGGKYLVGSVIGPTESKNRTKRNQPIESYDSHNYVMLNQ